MTTTDLKPGVNIGAVRTHDTLWRYLVTPDGDNLKVQQDVGVLPDDYDVTGHAHVTFVPSWTKADPQPVFLKVPAGGVEVRAESDCSLRVAVLADDGSEIAHLTTGDNQYVVLAHLDLDGDALKAWYANGASDTY